MFQKLLICCSWDPNNHLFIGEQAQESLAAAMSLGDISDIVASWADCYKKSLKTYNFSL